MGPQYPNAALAHCDMVRGHARPGLNRALTIYSALTFVKPGEMKWGRMQAVAEEADNTEHKAASHTPTFFNDLHYTRRSLLL